MRQKHVDEMLEAILILVALHCLADLELKELMSVAAQREEDAHPAVTQAGDRTQDARRQKSDVRCQVSDEMEGVIR